MYIFCKSSKCSLSCEPSLQHQGLMFFIEWYFWNKTLLGYTIFEHWRTYKRDRHLLLCQQMICPHFQRYNKGQTYLRFILAFMIIIAIQITSLQFSFQIVRIIAYSHSSPPPPTHIARLIGFKIKFPYILGWPRTCYPLSLSLPSPGITRCVHSSPEHRPSSICYFCICTCICGGHRATSHSPFSPSLSVSQ